jgi:hypothetical protein
MVGHLYQILLLQISRISRIIDYELGSGEISAWFCRLDGESTGWVARNDRSRTRLPISLSGRQHLLLSRGEETVWAWLGGSQQLVVADVVRLFTAKGRSDVRLTIGEPGKGLNGFRLTHRQAQAAHAVALRWPQTLTRLPTRRRSRWRSVTRR